MFIELVILYALAEIRVQLKTGLSQKKLYNKLCVLIALALIKYYLELKEVIKAESHLFLIVRGFRFYVNGYIYAKCFSHPLFIRL